MKSLDQITITFRNIQTQDFYDVYIDVIDCQLSKKWLTSFNKLLAQSYHLEKNYLFHGWTNNIRDGEFLCKKINETFDHINKFNSTNCWQNKGLPSYHIADTFHINEIISQGQVGDNLPGARLDHNRCNVLHHYFEDLQGTSEKLSDYYRLADYQTKWYIRQLNNLCHELESWAQSYRKSLYLPEWQRPSMIMCWLNAPRFTLDDEDLDAFGIETISRDFGGVYLGVNKAVGKHHYEVFRDEDGTDIDQLETTTLKGQTVANGDFDIDWGKSDRDTEWRIQENLEFTNWLTRNGFDPNDKSLTIGHPKIAQVNLEKSFLSASMFDIWKIIEKHMDVYKISTSQSSCKFDYHWNDKNYVQTQINILKPGYDYSSMNK